MARHPIAPGGTAVDANSITRSGELGRSRLPWLAADRAQWAAFFLLVVLGWSALFAMSLADSAGNSTTGADVSLWQTICGTGPNRAGLPALLAMWSLMSVAMMAPTIVPLLRLYSDLTRRRDARAPRSGFWSLVSGYAAVWLGFSVAAALFQRHLAGFGLVDAAGASISAWFTAALLAMAGLYQFSTLKAACLSRCRSPFAFLMAHWRDGAGGAARMGLIHGMVCLGCCWALMSLAFVGGTMNLLWMGGAMVLMIVEKLPGPGRHLTGPLGIALLTAATLTAADAAGLI